MPVQDTTTDNSWQAHIRGTLRIGLPLIGAQIAQQAIMVTDTVMLGWYGTEELAASVLGGTAFFIGFIFAIGLAQAVIPLASAAEGAGDVRGVRRSVRMGLWIVWMMALAILPLSGQSERLFLLVGQTPELSAMASDYLDIALWGLIPASTLMVLRSFLSAVERTGIILWATLLGAAMNAVANWMLIFGNWGAPEMGLRGAAIASVISHSAILVPVMIYSARRGGLEKYQLFVRIWRPDWPALRELARLGLPVSLTLLAEIGLFSASSVMMGWLGVVALAAHGIALQVISIIFMIPLGLASAATARIGRAQGRGDGLGVSRAAQAAMGMALGIAGLAAVVLWLVPEALVGAFLDHDDVNRDAVVATGAVLLAVAAVFQLFDTGQVMSAALLRGLKDTRVPMIFALISYWVIGIPVAYVLAFKAGYGGPGVWAGLAAGLMVAAVLLTWRFVHRDRYGFGV